MRSGGAFVPLSSGESHTVLELFQLHCDCMFFENVMALASKVLYLLDVRVRSFRQDLFTTR